MKTILVRYRTHPVQADANARAIEAVFRELAARQPAGVRYTALRSADGTFVHLAALAAGATLTDLDAFRTFQAGLKTRCVEPPVAQELAIVGSYRLFE